MADCLFCKIAAGQIKGDIFYKDEQIIALRDINPQAPVHLLVLPVVHLANLAEAQDKAPALLAELVKKSADLGRSIGGDKGYRLVVNTGPDGGQTVEHLHFHLLAGRELLWPPG